MQILTFYDDPITCNRIGFNSERKVVAFITKDLIDEARDEGKEEGREEGREEGKEEGEEEEFDRLKDRYLEIKKEKIGDIILPEFGVLRYLITDLDELFEATE